MKTKYTLTLLLNLFYLFSYSQGEYVIEINNKNGSFTKTGPAISGITYIYPDDRTYDENTGTFIFPSSLINHSLFSINVSNGSIVNNPIVGNISTFQFDNDSNILYGLEKDNVNNVKNFISINPVTGTYTQIGNSLPSSSMFSGGFSTFDKINTSYIFLAPPNIIYSINAINGNIISNPALVLASGENIVNFSFNNSTGVLYGLLQDNNIQKFFLVTINTTTGTSTRIGSGTTLGSGNGSSTIDEKNQHFIYMYSSPTAGGYVITTLEMATGNVVNNALIQAYLAQDNFYSLKYDNIQGKFYSIHYETDSLRTSIAEQNNSDNIINIYPNPFSTQTVLQTDNPLHNAILSVDNCFGQTVKQIKNISGQAVILSRDNLSNGVYFVRLIQDNKVIKTKRILITD
ncbi:MAG: T9SS type A sorting domain-containing protein [Saprospiraceae bacterium]